MTLEDKITRVLRAIGLAKLSIFKLATPFDFKAKKPDEFKIVYRSQNTEGESPYATYREGTWPSVKDSNEWARLAKPEAQPVPEDDIGFDKEDFEIYQNEEKFRKYWLFGFLNNQQYEEWFSEKERELLERNSFYLTPIKAKEIRKSDKQIFYRPR
jgi:hypothetical protein